MSKNKCENTNIYYLSSMLFQMFINDLLCCTNNPVHSFADDKKMPCSFTSTLYLRIIQLIMFDYSEQRVALSREALSSSYKYYQNRCSREIAPNIAFYRTTFPENHFKTSDRILFQVQCIYSYIIAHLFFRQKNTLFTNSWNN